MATTKCDVCKIRTGCDWLSEMCRLSPREVVEQRPDLLSRNRRRKRSYFDERERRHRQQIINADRRIAEYIATGANGDWIEDFHRQNIESLRTRI